MHFSLYHVCCLTYPYQSPSSLSHIIYQAIIMCTTTHKNDSPHAL
jgi:hypothetical protein